MMRKIETALPEMEWQSLARPDRPLTGLTVLVVEDSRFASEALRLLCLRSGARIRRADTLKAAMRHLATYRPGALIVDMGLPDGSGAELISAFAGAVARPSVIIAISGDPAAEAAARAAGADDFLAKPIESLALFQQKILAVMPIDERPRILRLLPDEQIYPDLAALKDDLAHVIEVLGTCQDNATMDYIAQFLAGVARSVHDKPLEEAATSLAKADLRDGSASASLTHVNALVRQRLGASARL